MTQAIVPAVLFLAAGITLIWKRRQAAHGFSLIMGGTTPPLIMTILGAFFIILAFASILLYSEGYLGK